MRPHRQRRIQKQHAGLGPRNQAAVSLWRNFKPDIFVKLLEDILEGRGFRNARLNGESQPVGLSRFVIRVLSQDDHLYILIWCVPKSVEDIVHRRIYRPLRIFLLQELPQVQIVALAEFLPKYVVPIISNIYHFESTSFRS